MVTTVKRVKEVIEKNGLVSTVNEINLIRAACAGDPKVVEENIEGAIIFFAKDLISKRVGQTAPVQQQPVQQQQQQTTPTESKDSKVPVLERSFDERVKLLDTFLSQQSIDFRVGMGKAGDKGFSLLGYKDARVDMDMLDAIIGKGYWQPKYRRDVYPNSKGGSSSTLICSLGLYNDDLEEWVWKESNGTESNTEQEKGQYSDAFKRAGFMWGIGRKLYDLPFIWINMQPEDVRNNKLTVRPNDWIWDVRNDGKRYTYLQAKDKKGVIRYTFGRP